MLLLLWTSNRVMVTVTRMYRRCLQISEAPHPLIIMLELFYIYCFTFNVLKPKFVGVNDYCFYHIGEEFWEIDRKNIWGRYKNRVWNAPKVYSSRANTKNRVFEMLEEKLSFVNYSYFYVHFLNYQMTV